MDFLPAGYVHFWYREVEVSNYNSGFVHLSLQFYQFLPRVFWHSNVRCIHIKDYYVFLENRPFYHNIMYLLIPDNLLALKCTWSEINIAVPAFFWLVLAWYMFFASHYFYLSVSLYLKWASCRKYSWFLFLFCFNWHWQLPSFFFFLILLW